MNLKINKATACTIAGVIGVAVTAFLSYKAGRKVEANPAPEVETKKEKAVRLAKTYGPALASAITTSAFIISADRIHVGKELVLGSAVAMWKSGYLDLDKATKEVVGEEKAEEIKSRLQPSYNCDMSQVLNAIRVYEPFTDQYIWTTKETIAWALLEANKELNKNYICPLNYFIVKIGGRPKPIGESLSWNTDSETLDYNWSFYGVGPWIDAELVPRKHGPEIILDLFYPVEPVRPSFDDKLYREAN